MESKQKLYIFIILLLAILAFISLFASGVFRFGMNSTYSYLLYVFAGLLSAVVCYGMLNSIGELEGKNINSSIKLGGSVIALCLVTFGGGYYERNLRTPEYFDARLTFYVESPSKPQRISGNISLYVGNEIKTIQLKEESTALFQGISQIMEGKSMKISLEGSKYIIDDEVLKNIKFNRNEPTFIKIIYGKTYAKPDEAKLDLVFKEGATVNYGPQPKDKILTIVLSAFSHSDYIIPIDRTAKLFLDDGMHYSMELKNQDNVYLTPHEFNDVSFEGIIPKSILSRMIGGSAGMVTIKYDNLYVKSDSMWTTNFIFSRETINEW